MHCTDPMETCLGFDPPADNPYDSSFITPYPQNFEAGVGLCANNWGIINSLAQFGYLNSATDFDVYNYSITAFDYLQALGLGPPFNIPGTPTTLVTFNVLPQACENNLDVYFSYALVADPGTLFGGDGPLGPTDYSTLPPDLAAQLSPGKTVIVVHDDHPDSGINEDRHIFQLGPDELEVDGIDLGWFLPKGCTNTDDEISCSRDARTIFTYAFNPAWSIQGMDPADIPPLPVQVVVFMDNTSEDPTSSTRKSKSSSKSSKKTKKQKKKKSKGSSHDAGFDYTLNLGFSEQCFEVAPEGNQLRAVGNNHLVNGCVPLELP